MRILDKYIVSEYLKTLLIILLAFSVLMIVVEVSDRMPRLIRKGAEPADMFVFFLLRLPYLFLLTAPIVVLLSGLFLMNNLSKYSESVAIRGAGISVVRMVTPLFWVGLLISIFVLILGEVILPRAEEYRQYVYTERIKGQKVEDKKMRSRIHYRGEDGNLYYIGFFDGYRNRLKTIDITTYNGEEGLIDKKITAANAIWTDEHWLFENCYIREFKHGRMISMQYFENTAIEEVDVKPIDFVKSAKKPMSMNYLELREYINRLKKVGEKYHKEQVVLNQKISYPFSNLIILLFCIPLVSVSHRSRGRGLMFGMGLGICFLFLSVIRIFQSLGENGMIEPFWATWIPNIIFTAIGLYALVKAEV